MKNLTENGVEKNANSKKIVSIKKQKSEKKSDGKWSRKNANSKKSCEHKKIKNLKKI